MAEGQVVVFELSGVCYGIDIIIVQEIIRMVEVTPVANADFAVEGVINLRGHVIPVINLSRRLGLPVKEKDRETRIIVVDNNGKKTGLVVDRVLEVGTYNSGEVEDPSVIGEGAAFLLFIVKKREHLWLVLNMSELSWRGKKWDVCMK